jgi:hypothetical protein
MTLTQATITKQEQKETQKEKKYALEYHKMKQKAFYTAIIGLLAIMLISTTLITVRGNQYFERSYGTTKTITDIKAEMQSTRYILDITTTDAISDTITKGSCSLPGSLPPIDTSILRDKMKTYFQNSINEMNSGCKLLNDDLIITLETNIGIGQPEGGAGLNIYDINAAFDLECKIEKNKGQITETSINYTKKVRLEKQLATRPSTGCEFTIIDVNSGFPEKTSFNPSLEPSPLNPIIPGALVIEAETGTLFLGMQTQGDTTASGGQFIQPINTTGDKVEYQVTNPGTSPTNKFLICARVMTQSNLEDDLMIDITGGIGCTTPECRTWHLLQEGIDGGYSTTITDWKWDSVNTEGTNQIEYAINPHIIEFTGTITLTLEVTGETGMRIDKLMIIPEKYACPTNQY